MEPVWNVKITNYQMKMAIRGSFWPQVMKPPEIMGEAQAEWGFFFRHGHRRSIRLTVNVRCLGGHISADRFLKCPRREMNDDWLPKWRMCYTYDMLAAERRNIIPFVFVMTVHRASTSSNPLVFPPIWPKVCGQRLGTCREVCLTSYEGKS